MRFTAYAGTSTVLATGVIIRALHERANFYSACVYVAQSNACLMILTNVALLGVALVMLGLQKLFYGPLRPIEVEQLYEKAWFAITETCLAMTIFREEVGGWFLVMFVSLLIGKVWGWIGEGRVEILEQQPPSNPRLFHARLSLSLALSTCFEVSMLYYSIQTVLLHARPNMMVMFAFEFAVLFVTSIATASRYGISLWEAGIIKRQIKERRAQLRRVQEQLRSAEPASEASVGVSPEDDVNALEIDVPGWEEKGRWVFYLDLATDFVKLVLYLTFFSVLCMFYGMPIHIIRDVALTIRSFHKRIADFVRYRQATRDMNERYPDATAEEIAREDTCIICREDMRAWSQHASQQDQQGDNVPNNGALPPVDERLRPKKLPCGHILHFACLRSWLERQQNCPTCRRPVLSFNSNIGNQTPQARDQQAQGAAHNNNRQRQLPVRAEGQQPVPAQNIFQLGPLRIAFGARERNQGQPQGNDNAVQPHAPNAPNAPNAQRTARPSNTIPRVRNPFGLNRQGLGIQSRTVDPTIQLQHVEQNLVREINGLRLQADQLYIVRALQIELARLRQAHGGPDGLQGTSRTFSNETRPGLNNSLDESQFFRSSESNQSIGAGHQHLPPGMTLPDGWTVLPLQRLHGEPTPESAIIGSAYEQQRDPGPLTTQAMSVQASPVNQPRQTGSVSNSSNAVGPVPPTESTFPSQDGRSIIDNNYNDQSNRDSNTNGSSDLPQWGSPSSSGNKSRDARDGAGPATFEGRVDVVDAGQVREPNDSGSQHKGKGRQTTVEDPVEERA